MASLQLYCVSHKPADLPKISGLNLIQVGSSPVDFGKLRDNTGDNIAGKNGEYSELTAHYFAWKNLPSDLIGFCHYRRFLLPPASRQWLQTVKPGRHGSGYSIPEAMLMEHLDSLGDDYLGSFAALLDKVDIILPQATPLKPGGFISQYLGTHYGAPLFRTLALLAEDDDVLGKSDYRYLTRATQAYWNNLFVARWDIFDRYCQFLFPLLARLEREVSLPDSTYQRRVFAFLSERLFNLWLARHRLTAGIVDWCIVEESLAVKEAHHRD